MEYAIETFSLTKNFTDRWGRVKVCAVDDLNMQILPNEVFGLLGPNGSGKTTTIKMLLGLLHPTQGKAFILSGESTNPKISSRVGFMPEESYLYRYLSARETLDFYGRLFKLPSAVRKQRIDTLLDMVGLQAVANRQVGTFSKGMARRIGLAQALINDPDVLILDEPTTGLDPIGTRQIKDLIMELAKRGKTILLCSHLLADVEDVCDRIAILYGGRIQAQGKVKELLQQTGKRQITTDSLSENAVSEISRIINEENADFEITSPMDRLETFFIRTVEKAQLEDQKTSGAVSTTKIGSFLSSSTEEKSAKLLDKLVSGKEESMEVVSSEKVSISKVSNVKDKTSVTKEQPAADEKLLKDLTDNIETVKPEPKENEESKKPEPVENENLRENILEQLTGKSDKNSKTQTEQTDNQQPRDDADA